MYQQSAYIHDRRITNLRRFSDTRARGDRSALTPRADSQTVSLRQLPAGEAADRTCEAFIFSPGRRERLATVLGGINQRLARAESQTGPACSAGTLSPGEPIQAHVCAGALAPQRFRRHPLLVRAGGGARRPPFGRACVQAIRSSPVDHSARQRFAVNVGSEFTQPSAA